MKVLKSLTIAITGVVVCTTPVIMPQKASSEEPKFIGVVYKSEFVTNHQKYWFFVTRYVPDVERLNISKPNFKDARPLKILEYEYNYIENVKKVPGQNAKFYFNVNYGNGSGFPVVTYMLNLTNPNKPKLTKIRTFRHN